MNQISASILLDNEFTPTHWTFPSFYSQHMAGLFAVLVRLFY